MEFLQFGFPTGAMGLIPENPPCENYKGAGMYPNMMDRYVKKELEEGAIIGPFQEKPFTSKVMYSHMTSTDKKDSMDSRVVMDFTFPSW